MCQKVGKWAYLRAWNWQYNIGEEAISEKIQQAERDNAPEDALYFGTQGWVRLKDIKSPVLRKEIRDRANGRAQDTTNGKTTSDNRNPRA